MNLSAKRKLLFLLTIIKNSLLESIEWKFIMIFKQEKKNSERKNKCFRNNKSWCINKRKMKRKRNQELWQDIINQLQRKHINELLQEEVNDQLHNKNTIVQKLLPLKSHYKLKLYKLPKHKYLLHNKLLQ